jgi:hypothetical protein
VPEPDAEKTSVTTVRGLLAGAAEDQAIAREMSDRLPAGGVARAALPEEKAAGGYRLLKGTYRLLDGEILLAAVKCLDQDVAGPIAEWLRKFRELRAAAATTLADPAARETVVLDIRRTLTASQEVAVHMHVGGTQVATFPFRLVLSAELGRTAVVVREGAVHQIDCVAASLKARLTFADVPKHLWEHSNSDLALHLSLTSPVRIPLVPVPRPAEPPAAQPHAIT